MYKTSKIFDLLFAIMAVLLVILGQPIYSAAFLFLIGSLLFGNLYNITVVRQVIDAFNVWVRAKAPLMLLNTDILCVAIIVAIVLGIFITSPLFYIARALLVAYYASLVVYDNKTN